MSTLEGDGRDRGLSPPPTHTFKIWEEGKGQRNGGEWPASGRRPGEAAWRPPRGCAKEPVQCDQEQGSWTWTGGIPLPPGSAPHGEPGRLFLTSLSPLLSSAKRGRL